MRPISRAILFSFLFSGCQASTHAPDRAPGGAKPPGGAAEKFGVLAPLEPRTIELWPEAYGGSWIALEVLPPGSAVKQGDVIARCDTRAIDDELHRGELELASAEIAHRSLLERGKLDADGAGTALARARAGLERSRRSLASWKEKELAFASRSDTLSKRWEEAGVEDQKDELDQLEKMYQADELVDATEDIVLKRSRRALALTQDQNALSRDRASNHQELELVLQTEQREEEFAAQAESVARLERQQAIDARAREDAAARSADALAEQRARLERLRRDRALFVLAAPADGVLLHGSPEDYRPGKTPARYQRGSQLGTRTVLFQVAAPGPSGVAFDVAEGELASFQDGARVEVRSGDARAGGTVRLDELPRSLGAGEATFEAFATLEEPLAGGRYGQRVRIEAQR